MCPSCIHPDNEGLYATLGRVLRMLTNGQRLSMKHKVGPVFVAQETMARQESHFFRLQNRVCP